jgi:hypothetical protein
MTLFAPWRRKHVTNSTAVRPYLRPYVKGKLLQTSFYTTGALFGLAMKKAAGIEVQDLCIFV